MLGALFWRRPTLARPIAVLPSGLQRFTSVFGMGTGGTTTLMSPEINGEGFAANLWRVIREWRFVTSVPIHDSRSYDLR
jgi:hypothetical protein